MGQARGEQAAQDRQHKSAGSEKAGLQPVSGGVLDTNRTDTMRSRWRPRRLPLTIHKRDRSAQHNVRTRECAAGRSVLIGLTYNPYGLVFGCHDYLEFYRGGLGAINDVIRGALGGTHTLCTRENYRLYVHAEKNALIVQLCGKKCHLSASD